MTVRRVMQHVAPFTPYTTGAEALACFAADPGLHAAPVVDHAGTPLGVVARVSLKMKLADKAGHEMFAAAPVTAIMDHGPLIVDGNAPLAMLCDEILRHRPQALADGFVITEQGRYLGFGLGQALLTAVFRDNVATHERLDLAMRATRSVAWEIDYEGRRLIGAEQLDRLYRRPIAFDDVRRMTANFVAPEDREMLRRTLSDLAGGEGQGVVQCRFRRADGEERWAEHTVEVVRGPDRKVARMILMSADVTRRREALTRFQTALDRMESVLAGPQRDLSIPAQDWRDADQVQRRLAHIINEIVARDRALVAAVEAAESASEAKSRFLASMSHELRTPLNAILGYSEILNEELATAGMISCAEDARRINAAARHLLHLINEVLDLSRIEAGRMDVNAEDFDVAAVVRGAAESVRPLADKNGDTISISLAPDLGQALTDGAKLRQCLTNLLSNACKFTEKGEVRLSAGRKLIQGRDNLVFEIADSGIGMDERQIEVLFQPFTQGDGSATRNFGGAGLGLALARHLARLMGGDIEVRSAPGKGSTFRLHVPTHFTGAAQPVASEQRSAPASPIEIKHGSPVVLVIDNDKAARDLTRHALSRLGLTIREADTGETGLAIAREFPLSLILLDVRLPDMSGWGLLESLKQDADVADTPVLVLSIDDDRDRALDLGACEHVVKPAERDQIAAAVVRHARFETSDKAPAMLKSA